PLCSSGESTANLSFCRIERLSCLFSRISGRERRAPSRSVLGVAIPGLGRLSEKQDQISCLCCSLGPSRRWSSEGVAFEFLLAASQGCLIGLNFIEARARRCDLRLCRLYAAGFPTGIF